MNSVFFVGLIIVCILLVYCYVDNNNIKERFVTDNELMEKGYMVFKNSLSGRYTDKIMNFVNKTIESDSISLGHIDVKNNRRIDLLLPLSKNLIKTVYNKIKHVIDVYDDDPLLFEHSCFINFPYSDPQNWHRDIDFKEEYKDRVFSIGVFLQDTTKNMGTLQIVPNSHNADSDIEQLECNKKLDTFCGYFHNVKDYIEIEGRKGTIVIWNNLSIHRSNANLSGTVRCIYYFSLLCNLTDVPKGSSYSLTNKKKLQKISEIIK